jgi:hypothetical protein
VRRPARNHHAGTGAEFDVVVAEFYAENSFENVPGFIIAAMEVQRRDVSRLGRDAACILPFGDHEIIDGGAENVSG